MIDVRHRKFVYKVQSVRSPKHPTTSFHVTPQNISTSFASSSNVMKMDETLTQTADPNKYFSDESLVVRNTELLALSVINSRQQNPVPTITFNETEQFPSSLEAHPDTFVCAKDHPERQMNSSNEPIQQINASYEGKLSDGTSFYNTNYTFTPELNTSFTIPNDFDTKKISIFHYDEMPSDLLLQDSDKPHIQHAPLFGCAAENLYNFPTSDFDSLGSVSDKADLTVTDDHCRGQQVVMGLTKDGCIIIDGLSMPITEKENISWQNQSGMFCTMNTDEGTTSLSESQILDDLDGKHQGIKQETKSDEVVTGLTAHGEFIIANTIDSTSRVMVTTHLISVIMGLTASGHIICGGCVADIIPQNLLTTCEETIESNDHHNATFHIIGNLTAKNEKVLIGLTDSGFTSVYGGSLLRRDSF